jgi:hypothetical protein
MTLKWLNEEEGTVGQFRFAAFQPVISPPPIFPPSYGVPNRSAQTTRFQTLVTLDSVMVVASINRREWQRGRVLQSQVIAANQVLRGRPESPPGPGIGLLGIEIDPGTSRFEASFGHYPYGVINQVLKALGFPQVPSANIDFLPSYRYRGLLGLEGNLGQPVTTVGLIGGHIYRARWLVTNPIPLLGCDALPLAPIIQNILNIPGTGPTFPADLLVLTIPSADWEADRRDVPHAANECVVYAQMRAISDQLLPIGSMQQALQPVGGRLIDFWDATFGITLIDNRTSDSPAPHASAEHPASNLSSAGPYSARAASAHGSTDDAHGSSAARDDQAQEDRERGRDSVGHRHRARVTRHQTAEEVSQCTASTIVWVSRRSRSGSRRRLYELSCL